jgi:arginine deiminase
MSITQVIDTILTRPVVHIAFSGRDTGMTASYSFRPLSNLIYTRDQQITTCKGIVMARLRSQQRQDEVALMKYVVTKIGEAAFKPPLALSLPTARGLHFLLHCLTQRRIHL